MLPVPSTLERTPDDCLSTLDRTMWPMDCSSGVLLRPLKTGNIERPRCGVVAPGPPIVCYFRYLAVTFVVPPSLKLSNSDEAESLYVSSSLIGIWLLVHDQRLLANQVLTSSLPITKPTRHLNVLRSNRHAPCKFQIRIFVCRVSLALKPLMEIAN